MEGLPACEELMLIVCQREATEQVIERIRQVGVARFTLHHGALGAGETGRHESTPIWPGDNTIIFCCIPEEQVEGVVRTLRALHDSRPQHSLGLKIFALPVRELL